MASTYCNKLCYCCAVPWTLPDGINKLSSARILPGPEYYFAASSTFLRVFNSAFYLPEQPSNMLRLNNVTSPLGVTKHVSDSCEQQRAESSVSQSALRRVTINIILK